MSMLLALLLTAPIQDEPISLADRLAHEQMLTLDSHLDTPVLFEEKGWDFTRYNQVDFDKSQVDIPRMEQGGLDGGFFVIYTGQGEMTQAGMENARNAALRRAMWIQRVVTANPNKLEIALTADDAARITKSGKRFVYQAIENSYPLGNDLGLLRYYYDLGVRMASPVHFRNNQFADSATDPVRKWKGYSPLGKEWVKEMNRLGMVIDLSHASDDVLEQSIALSKTPVILSHSGMRAVYDHPRNISDDLLRKLAASGGVIQINSVYMTPFDSDKDRAAVQKRQDHWHHMSHAEQRDLVDAKMAADANPYPNEPDFDLFMQNVLHAIKVAGVDHVGIGADWDGGGGVKGMNDVTTLPKITARLRKEGYSLADIEKIWSGNALRVLRAAEEYAAKNTAK